jgi:methionyl-tRNA formyltransferase
VSRTAQQIYDRWRGFQPWPGAHTMLRGKKLIVQKMHVTSTGGGEPGVVDVHGDTLLVGCGDGSTIRFDELQLEGKRRMSASDFLRGNQIRSGERLGL